MVWRFGFDPQAAATISLPHMLLCFGNGAHYPPPGRCLPEMPKPRRVLDGFVNRG